MAIKTRYTIIVLIKIIHIFLLRAFALVIYYAKNIVYVFDKDFENNNFFQNSLFHTIFSTTI